MGRVLLVLAWLSAALFLADIFIRIYIGLGGLSHSIYVKDLPCFHIFDSGLVCLKAVYNNQGAGGLNFLGKSGKLWFGAFFLLLQLSVLALLCSRFRASLSDNWVEALEKFLPVIVLVFPAALTNFGESLAFGRVTDYLLLGIVSRDGGAGSVVNLADISISVGLLWWWVYSVVYLSSKLFMYILSTLRKRLVA